MTASISSKGVARAPSVLCEKSTPRGRLRGGLDGHQDDVLPPVEAGNLTHADIRYERRVELATEGKRYNDLARWHRAGLIDIPFDIDFGSGQANENWTEQNLLRPIPQTRLDNNTNLVQNSRYD